MTKEEARKIFMDSTVELIEGLKTFDEIWEQSMQIVAKHPTTTPGYDIAVYADGTMEKVFPDGTREAIENVE